MKQYKVLVTETFQKLVAIEAESAEDARQRAEDAWRNTEYILDIDDFQDVNFHVVEMGVKE